MKSNVTYIIPLKTSEALESARIETMFKSILEMKGEEKPRVTVICEESMNNLVNENAGKNISLTIINCSQEDDLFTKINKGVYQCLTKYFMIFEPDIWSMEYWKDISDEVMNSDKQCGVVFPLIETYNDENKFLGFKNEIVWSPSFDEDINNLGCITLSGLEIYKDFDLYGALVKTEDFISVGGLKPSLGVASWYEFCIRLLRNSITLKVAPRVGCCRINQYSENNYVSLLMETPQDKALWLIETAKEESFFKEDREKTFENRDK